MARLILSIDGQVLAEYNMTKERYTVGRLPDNDVRIDNPAVSGHRALVINILNDSFLEDLNSTNGTYVNGKLIKKHALQHGDVVTVGHHHLRFVDSQVDSAEQDEFERTMVIGPGQISEGQLRAGVQVGAISRRADGYFIVHVESSKPGDYPLVNGQTIGPQARRLADNDVITLAGVKMGFFEA
ncbi:MAG: FHA domain-containing protein [Gammaproteobacteria bacterium]|nr:FHA domain-containing protein [Gammaproteobacteria bacterium]